MVTTNPRIEAAARAIYADACRGQEDYPTWDNLLELSRKKYIRIATAALAAADAAAWRPIEEYTKRDERHFDLWTKYGERIADARWNMSKARWEVWGTDGFESPGWETVDAPVTHFRELPPPPQPDAAEVG